MSVNLNINAKTITGFSGIIDVHPMSLNQAYNRGNSRKLSDMAEQFKTLCMFELHNRYKSKITKLRKIFDPDKHVIRTSYVFSMKGMYYKNGRLAKNGGDVSNYFKLFEDVLFNLMNIDDSQTHIIKGMKICHNEESFILFRIRIMERSDMVTCEKMAHYLDYLEGLQLPSDS